MTKEEKKNYRLWQLHCIRIALDRDSHKQLKEDGKDTGNSGNQRKPKGPFVSEASTMQPAVGYYNPSFVCYLVAAARLLKQAFSHKKGKHFFIIR